MWVQLHPLLIALFVGTTGLSLFNSLYTLIKNVTNDKIGVISLVTFM